MCEYSLKINIRYAAAILWILIGLRTVFGVTASEENNELIHPGFEEIEKIELRSSSWECDSKKENVEIEIDSSTSFRGAHSVRFVHSKAASAYIKQRVRLEPDTDYYLSAWIKGIVPNSNSFNFFNRDMLQGCQGFEMTVIQLNGRGFPNSTTQRYHTGIFDWRKVDTIFNSGTNVEAFIIFWFRNSLGTLWIDDASLSLLSDSAVAIGDISPQDTEKKTDLAKISGSLTVFQIPWMERTYTTRMPKKNEISVPFSIRAARGEFESLTFGVYADKNVTDIRTEISGDFIHTDGRKKILKTDVTLHTVGNQKWNIDGYRYINIPTYLEKNHSVDINSRRTQRYWLTVHVPLDAAEGLYKSSVRIIENNKIAAEIPLTVQVRSFTLPIPPVSYFMYFDKNRMNGQDKHIDTNYLKEIYTDMKNHGMTTMTIYNYPWHQNQYGEMVFDTKNDYMKKFTESDIAGKMGIETVINLAGECGFIHPGIGQNKTSRTNFPLLYLCHSGVTNYELIATFCPGIRTINLLTNLVHKNNWPELLFYVVDEPGTPNRIEEAKKALTILENASLPVRKTTAMVLGGVKEGLMPRYDINIIDIPQLSPELYNAVKSHQDAGNILWGYDCQQNGNNPQVERYMYGYYCWRMGFTGFGQWVYACENREDYSRNLITYGHVLLTSNGIVSTIGWEGKREGIDDYRYLFLLKTRADSKRKGSSGTTAEVIQKADTLLLNIQKIVRYDSFHERFNILNHSDYRLDNQAQSDIPMTKYDNWRETAADLIEKLSEP